MYDMQKKPADPSRPEEQLVLVDEDDRILGYGDKAICHSPKGLLHRAFSVFAFDDRKMLLLQQRSQDKLLWPLYWSNSVCSHPHKGETYEAAAARRMKEELGLESEPEFLFKFQYTAQYGDVGSEHEVCAVFITRILPPLHINKEEIEEVKYLSMEALDEEIRANPAIYTPWFKIEWKLIKEGFLHQIDRCIVRAIGKTGPLTSE